MNCDYTETDRNQSKLPLPGVDASIAFTSLHSDVTRNFCFCCCCCGYCNSQYPIQHTQGGRAGRTTTDCAAATTPPTTTRTNEHAQLIIIIIIIGSYAVQLHTPCQLCTIIYIIIIIPVAMHYLCRRRVSRSITPHYYPIQSVILTTLHSSLTNSCIASRSWPREINKQKHSKGPPLVVLLLVAAALLLLVAAQSTHLIHRRARVIGHMLIIVL